MRNKRYILKYVYIICLLFLLLNSSPSLISAQIKTYGTVRSEPSLTLQNNNDEKEHKGGWMNVGIGGGYIGVGLGLNMNFTVKNDLFLQFNFAFCEEILIFGDDNPHNLTSIGLLIGKRAKADLFMVSFSVGAGLISRTDDIYHLDSWERVRLNNPALLSNIQLFFKPSKSFGVGLDFTGSLSNDNAGLPIFIMLSLQFSNGH